MAVRSTPATRPTTAGDSIDEYFPLTREQLQAPAIPRVRLSLRPTPPAAGSSPLPPAMARHETTNTIAARSRVETEAGAAGPALPTQPFETAGIRFDAATTGHVGPAHSAFPAVSPDVRFAPRTPAAASPSLAEMAAVAFPPGQVPWEAGPAKSNTKSNRAATAGGVTTSGGDLSIALAAATRRSRQASGDYPYWVVALIQILIGTILVIMVVNFANARRETAATNEPQAEQAASVEPGLRINWMGRATPPRDTNNAGIFEF